MPFLRRSKDELPLEEVHGLKVSSLFHPEEADQLSVRWIEAAPGTEVPPSHHRIAREVLYILEGGGEFEVGGQTVTCQAGDFLNVPPGSSHSMVAGPEGVRFLAIQSPPVERDRDLYWGPPPEAPSPLPGD